MSDLYAVKIALDSIGQAVHATRLTLPESAAIQEMKLYSHQAGGNVRLALYGEGASGAKTLLWQSAPTSNTVANGWLSVPVASGTPSILQLRAGTYWLAFNTDSTNHFASYSPGAGGDGFRVTQPFGAFPAALAADAVTPGSDRWSEYLTYTPTFVDAPPAVPAVSVSPAAPGTLDDVTAIASATDPDASNGDYVAAYRYEWSLGGAVKCTSATLPASLTTRGQQWTLKVWALDSYGQWSEPGQSDFTIANTPPSQPIVEIVPQPARAGQDLIVDVQTYSTDPDGDTVAYDFNWYKSTDGGATWTHKVELDGSPQVSGNYIHDGELWEVRYIPYEKAPTPTKPGAAHAPLSATRVEGKYGWDRAYIGANTPPTLALETPTLQRQAGGTRLSVGWSFFDADGDARTVDLEWTNKTQPSYKPLAAGLPVRQGTFRALTSLPLDQPVTIHAIIRDSKGAMAQQISAPALVLPPSPALVAAYLMGRGSDPAGLDVNQDGRLNVIDLLKSVAATLPEIPARPSPADGASAVSTTPGLDWADCPHAQSYQVYLWKAGTARPATPAATGLAASAFTPKTALNNKTTYWWQVVAMTAGGLKTSGPVWTLSTR